MNLKELKECFRNAKKSEERGEKHKGLLIVNSNHKKAEEYIIKAKNNLELCEFYKEKQADYKLPEEWFYILYYCALAIISKFGIESRSQKYTALFLEYTRDKRIIDYDKEFIDRIKVYKKKGEESDVDKREEARYGSSVKSKEAEAQYNIMMNICKKAISQAEEIIYSNEKLEIPKELLD